MISSQSRGILSSCEDLGSFSSSVSVGSQYCLCVSSHSPSSMSLFVCCCRRCFPFGLEVVSFFCSKSMMTGKNMYCVFVLLNLI